MLYHVRSYLNLTFGELKESIAAEMQYYRWLLQGVDDFSEEKVEELALFAVNRGPEVMGEVLRAAVRRFAVVSASCFHGGIHLSVSVDQGWGGPDTFKLTMFQLKGLNSVAKSVGITYNIVEVDMAHCVKGKKCMALGRSQAWINVKFLAMIANHMEEQTESMDSLKLCAWDSNQSPISEKHFFSLLKVTKEWKIMHIGHDTNFVEFFADLPTAAADAGHIDRFTINEKRKFTSLELDVLKRIWEISVTVRIWPATSSTIISVGGGRGENPEAGWKQLLDYFHSN